MKMEELIFVINLMKIELLLKEMLAKLKYV